MSVCQTTQLQLLRGATWRSLICSIHGGARGRYPRSSGGAQTFHPDQGGLSVAPSILSPLLQTVIQCCLRHKTNSVEAKMTSDIWQGTKGIKFNQPLKILCCHQMGLRLSCSCAETIWTLYFCGIHDLVSWNFLKALSSRVVTSLLMFSWSQKLDFLEGW